MVISFEVSEAEHALLQRLAAIEADGSLPAIQVKRDDNLWRVATPLFQKGLVNLYFNSTDDADAGLSYAGAFVMGLGRSPRLTAVYP